MDTVNQNLDTSFGQLKHMGAGLVAQAWQQHGALLEGEAVSKWLAIAGGLSLLDVKTDMDLLVLAERAPNDLLFGLVYGKLADALAMNNQSILTPAHHVRITRGQRSAVLNDLYETALARGHQLELQAEEADDEFFENQVSGQSRSNFDELVEQAANAPDAFTLGQMTSWVLTNHRLRHPYLYTQVISTLTLSDVNSDALADYCSPTVRELSLVACHP